MSLKIIKYHRVFNAFQTLLDITGIDEFPFNFGDLFSKKKRAPILVSSMKDYNAWIFSKHPSQWDPIFVLDAECFCYPDRDTYMILYNEARPETRIRFSLTHELGRIVLGHLNNERTEISRDGVDDPTYYALEGTAGTFAGSLLTFPMFIDDFLAGVEFDVERISTRFNISPSTAKDYRAKGCRYQKTLNPSKHEKTIPKKYHPGLHKQVCIECSAAFKIEGALFCPICGANSSSICYRGEDDAGVIYSGAELEESGQAKECLQCKNKEHLADAEFCMICRKPVINRCTSATDQGVSSECWQCSHNEPLPGNARYCPYCGSKATFYEQRILFAYNNDDVLPPPF